VAPRQAACTTEVTFWRHTAAATAAVLDKAAAIDICAVDVVATCLLGLFAFCGHHGSQWSHTSCVQHVCRYVSCSSSRLQPQPTLRSPRHHFSTVWLVQLEDHAQLPAGMTVHAAMHFWLNKDHHLGCPLGCLSRTIALAECWRQSSLKQPASHLVTCLV